MAVVGAGTLLMALKASDLGRFAAAKPKFIVNRGRSASREEGGSKKGDNLAARDFAISSVIHFRAPITEKLANSELSRMHNIVHVLLPLSGSLGDDEDVPDFETIMHEPIEGEAQVEAPDAAEADVAIMRRDLSQVLVDADTEALSDTEVVKQVAEMMRLSQGNMSMSPAFTSQRMLSRTLRMSAEGAGDEATGGFGSLDVRIIPENVTTLALNTDSSQQFAELDAVVDPGGSLGDLLKAQGASEANSAAIVRAFGRAIAQLPGGQHVRSTIGPTPRGREIQRVVLYDERGPTAAVAENDEGQFAPVAALAPAEKDMSGRRSHPDEDVRAFAPEVYKSGYASSIKAGVPRNVVEDALRALGEGIDLKEPAASGDNLELVFINDDAPQRAELLFAQLTASGDKQSVYRYVPPTSEGRQFLAPTGVSLEKLLLRKPLANGRISSPFGMRRHPILHYARLHNGVDWAAPQGTPLLAAGDGVVKWAEPRSGYGNRLELEHEQGYASAYNHMSAYARGIKVGAHVQRGQVVGYVGTTGLSTGPHVHFEITSNGHFVDPMKVRLPSRRQLAGKELAEFDLQKAQVELLRTHTDKPNLSANFH